MVPERCSTCCSHMSTTWVSYHYHQHTPTKSQGPTAISTLITPQQNKGLWTPPWISPRCVVVGKRYSSQSNIQRFTHTCHMKWTVPIVDPYAPCCTRHTIWLYSVYRKPTKIHVYTHVCTWQCVRSQIW